MRFPLISLAPTPAIVFRYGFQNLISVTTPLILLMSATRKGQHVSTGKEQNDE